MSRLGKQPVEIPAGVDVKVDGRVVTVSKGSATLSIEHRPEVVVRVEDDPKRIEVTPAEGLEDNRQARAYWGMTRSLVQNMVEGVTKGYRKQLEVVGVGYVAQLAGNKLDLKVGFANTISVPIPAGLDVKVERQIITVEGADKQAVGEFAATVRAKRKPEPYNGKGIRYLGERVRQKQGKAFGS